MGWSARWSAWLAYTLGLALVGAGCAPGSGSSWEPMSPDTSAVPSGGGGEGTALVKFTSDDADVTLYVKRVDAASSDSRFREVCSAPCEQRLATGRYRVALSKGSRRRVEVWHTIDLDGPTVLKGEYEDGRGFRVAGGVVAGGGLLAGLVLAMSKEETCDLDDYCSDSHPYVGRGFQVALASVGVGLLLIAHRDQAKLTVSPGVAPAMQGTERAGSEGVALEGFTVSGRF